MRDGAGPFVPTFEGMGMNMKETFFQHDEARPRKRMWFFIS
jgi:hypothetical protein